MSTFKNVKCVHKKKSVFRAGIICGMVLTYSIIFYILGI